MAASQKSAEQCSFLCTGVRKAAWRRAARGGSVTEGHVVFVPLVSDVQMALSLTELAKGNRLLDAGAFSDDRRAEQPHQTQEESDGERTCACSESGPECRDFRGPCFLWPGAFHRFEGQVTHRHL